MDQRDPQTKITYNLNKVSLAQPLEPGQLFHNRSQKWGPVDAPKTVEGAAKMVAQIAKGGFTCQDLADVTHVCQILGSFIAWEDWLNSRRQISCPQASQDAETGEYKVSVRRQIVFAGDLPGFSRWAAKECRDFLLTVYPEYFPKRRLGIKRLAAVLYGIIDAAY